MKRCPECRRDYYDETLLYCLDDGSELLDGPASGNESATAILSEPPASAGGQFASESATLAQIHTTEKTATLPTDITRPRGSRRRILLASIAIAVLAGGGLMAYWYLKAANTSEISSIAVLPFANESGNPDIEYLSDGMTDTLINNLSRIPKLSVKARSSVFRYKGRAVDPQQVASELNVQAVVNGRVMQRGDNLTLNLEVVDARSGDQIWGEQYIRKIGDLVSLQSDIARDVSNKLRQKLSGADTERISKRGTDNTEAYQQYLKGRFHWNKRTMEDITKSIEYFQKAIEIDPSYALAYAGLADGYVVLPSYANNKSKEAFPKARAAATRALEIDNSLAEAHATLADVLFEFDWKFAEAEKEFKRAIELDPNYATAHHWYAEYLATQGRTDEAIAELKRAQECDPLSLIINSMLGLFMALNGDHAGAETQLKKTIEMDPNFARAHLLLAGVYEMQGKFEDAINEYEKHAALTGMPADVVTQAWGSVRKAYGSGGQDAYWQALLALAKKRGEIDPRSAPPPFVMAVLHTKVGDKDRAFEYLEKSYEQRDVGILRLNEPALTPLHSDPRYADLVRRVGIPQ